MARLWQFVLEPRSAREDRSAHGVLLRDHPAVHAPERFVVGEFQALEAFVVHTKKSEHRPGEGLFGIESFGFEPDPDFLVAELSDLLGPSRLHLSAEPDKLLVSREPLFQTAPVFPQDPGQLQRNLARIVDP